MANDSEEVIFIAETRRESNLRDLVSTDSIRLTPKVKETTRALWRQHHNNHTTTLLLEERRRRNGSCSSSSNDAAVTSKTERPPSISATPDRPIVAPDQSLSTDNGGGGGDNSISAVRSDISAASGGGCEKEKNLFDLFSTTDHHPSPNTDVPAGDTTSNVECAATETITASSAASSSGIVEDNGPSSPKRRRLENERGDDNDDDEVIVEKEHSIIDSARGETTATTADPVTELQRFREDMNKRALVKINHPRCDCELKRRELDAQITHWKQKFAIMQQTHTALQREMRAIKEKMTRRRTVAVQVNTTGAIPLIRVGKPSANAATTQTQQSQISNNRTVLHHLLGNQSSQRHPTAPPAGTLPSTPTTTTNPNLQQVQTSTVRRAPIFVPSLNGIRLPSDVMIKQSSSPVTIVSNVASAGHNTPPASGTRAPFPSIVRFPTTNPSSVGGSSSAAVRFEGSARSSVRPGANVSQQQYTVTAASGNAVRAPTVLAQSPLRPQFPPSALIGIRAPISSSSSSPAVSNGEMNSAASAASLQGRLYHPPLPILKPSPSPKKNLHPTALLPLPPRPEVSITKEKDRVTLCWRLAKQPAAPIRAYRVLTYQEASGNTWSVVGNVDAMDLPMACTLSCCYPGNRYFFAVVAEDTFGRFGPFSDVCSITL